MDKQVKNSGPERSFTKTSSEAFRHSNPMAMFGRMFGDQADKLFVNEKLAYTNFRHKAYEMVRAKNRSNNIFGRFYNWANGVSHENLKISGAVMAEAIKTVNGEAPENINRAGDYVLDYDKAMDLFEAFTDVLREQGAFEDS